MRVIVDTNLWISFLIGKRLSLLKALLQKESITVYICNELIQEFKEVASRDKIKKYISETDIIDTLEVMQLYCIHIPIKKKAKSPIRDAKDLFLLSLADSIPADYIITGDKDLLVLLSHNQTKIMTYSDFISLI